MPGSAPLNLHSQQSSSARNCCKQRPSGKDRVEMGRAYSPPSQCWHRPPKAWQSCSTLMYHGVHRCRTGPNITGHRSAILALVLMMVIVQQPAAIDGLRRKVAGYMHIHAHELPGICPNHSSSQYWWEKRWRNLSWTAACPWGHRLRINSGHNLHWLHLATGWLWPNTSHLKGAAASYMSWDDLLETAMEIAMMDSRLNGCFHRK